MKRITSAGLKAIAGLCVWIGPLNAANVVQDLHYLRKLTRAEIGVGLPLKLQAVVTYYVPERYRLYIQSGSDASFAEPADGVPDPHFQRGDFVEFTGHVRSGNLSPIVEFSSYRVIGHRNPSPPKTLTVSQTALFTSECHRAHFVGRILAANVNSRKHLDDFDSGGLDLVVGSLDSNINVTIDRPASLNPVTLQGADVEFDGTVAHNSQRGQFLGSMLFVQEAGDLRITKPGKPDPFSIPLLDIHNVLRSGTPNSDGLVHIQGTVTSQDLGGSFFVQDNNQGILVEASQPVRVQPGDPVDVVGYGAPGRYSPILRYAVLRKRGGHQQVQPARLRLLDIPTDFRDFDSSWLSHDGELVELEAELIGQRVSSRQLSLILRSGKTTLSAELQLPIGYGENFISGSWLRVRGVCSVVTAGLHNRPEGMDLLLRSTLDIEVIRTPPWWTGEHLLWILGAAAGCVILLSGWILTLRTQVRAQTAQLLQRATRDGLTRLWNRAEILGILARELVRARERGGALTIILIDLDHFKAINDTFGHQAGDAVLVEVSNRLSQKIRPCDSIGRYGGEELLAVLPGLEDGPDRCRIEQLRVVVSQHPIPFEEEPIQVTCSMGVTWSCDGSQSLDSVIKAADKALYCAKRNGRNRVEMNLETASRTAELQTK